jgi:hypothetical protein
VKGFGTKDFVFDNKFEGKQSNQIKSIDYLILDVLQ